MRASYGPRPGTKTLLRRYGRARWRPSRSAWAVRQRLSDAKWSNLTSDGALSARLRFTPRFQLTAVSAVLLLLGILGTWQKTLFGVSANGLEVGPILLVPALLLTGYARYVYHAGQEDQRKRIGWLLVVAAMLVALTELANAARVSGLVVTGWGTILAGVGATGLLVAGVWLLRSASLTT